MLTRKYNPRHCCRKFGSHGARRLRSPKPHPVVRSFLTILPLLLLVLLSLMPVKYVYLPKCILDVETEALEIALIRPLYWSGLVDTIQMQVDNVRVDWPVSDVPAQLSTVRLTKGSGDESWMRLTSLTLEAGSRVHINADNENGVEFRILQGRFRSNVLVHGEIKIDPPTVNPLPSEVDTVPDLISFSQTADLPGSARLTFLQLQKELDLRNGLVNGISFDTQVLANDYGDITLGSGIIGGESAVPDIGRTVVLSPGYFVNVDDVNGFFSVINVHDHLKLHFEGKAASIMIGPSGYQRELLPTVIEYLMYGQFFPFITVLVGLLVSYYTSLLPHVFRRLG